MESTIMLVIQSLGCVAFAVSGTLVGLRKRTDFIGAFLLAAFTSFGGGVIRDLMLGYTPPHLFSDRTYLILLAIVLGVSFITFHLAFIPKIGEKLTSRLSHDYLVNFTDAVGLAAFCVSGVDVALTEGVSSLPLLVIFCGCVTGVGGGILRDVFSAEIPLVFRKYVYIIPAFLGSTLYTVLNGVVPRVLAMILAMALILGIRIPAIVFRWNFPIPRLKGEETNAKK